MVACWTIWCHCRSNIFESRVLSLATWKGILREDLALILHREKPTLRVLLEKWLLIFNSGIG